MTEEKIEEEPVVHPSYYDWDSGEVIDVVGYLTFPAGNVIKYLLRPGKGHYKKDLQKALWYMGWWRIHICEREGGDGSSALYYYGMLSDFQSELIRRGRQAAATALYKVRVAFFEAGESAFMRGQWADQAIDAIKDAIAKESGDDA